MKRSARACIILFVFIGMLGSVMAKTSPCALQCGYFSCSVKNTQSGKRYERESSISKAMAIRYTLAACRREAGVTAERDCPAPHVAVCTYIPG